jgi:hypothetical protein
MPQGLGWFVKVVENVFSDGPASGQVTSTNSKEAAERAAARVPDGPQTSRVFAAGYGDALFGACGGPLRVGAKQDDWTPGQACWAFGTRRN